MQPATEEKQRFRELEVRHVRNSLPTADWALAMEGLSRRFGRVLAVNNLTLKVPSGCVFGLLGVNGAGKTTLLKLLMGHLRPTAGKATLLGYGFERDIIEIREHVGYVSEERYLYDWMSVSEILRFTRALHARWNDAKVEQLVGRFELPLDRRIRELSRGHRARLCLLLALAHDPDLIILDEPTSGLDPVASRSFRDTIIREIASEKRTVLLSSHNVEEIERIADYVGILHRGRLLVSAPLDDLKDSFKRIRIATNDVPRDFTHVPGVLAVSKFAREQILVMNNFRSTTLGIFCESGLPEPEVLPMSLEEIFLATVGGAEPTWEAP